MISRSQKFPFATVMGVLATIGVAVPAPSIAAQSHLTIATSTNPAVFGQPLSLTASLSPITATGRVTFYDGTAIIGIATVTAGQAALTTALLPAGPRALKAYYSGDANNPPGTSAPFAQTITPVPGLGFAAPLSYVTAVSSYPTGQAAFGVVGDFNGDGKPDLATHDFSPSPIIVFLGNGDGTFQAPKATSPSFDIDEMVVADVNGDGKADIIVAGPYYASGSAVSTVLLGNGDGTFQLPVTYPASSRQGPRSIAVGDFNGDGKPDLAVGLGSQVGIYLGNGDGTFQQVTVFDANPSINYSLNTIAIGDFNGDGIADIVAINATSGAVLLGNGDGTFSSTIPLKTNHWAAGIAVGDLNGDGIGDLATSSGEVFLGKGEWDLPFGAVAFLWGLQ